MERLTSMHVAFNIDRMQALGRSGVLRVSGTSDAREKTPLFVPTLHVPLLGMPAYARFIEQLVAGGKVRVALVPPQPDPSALADAIEKHSFLAKLLLLAEASGTAPPSVPPCTTSIPIHRSPYPSAAIDAASAANHARRFLDAANQQLAGSPEPVALAIDDHGFVDILESLDPSIVNARAWALAIESFDTGSYAVDTLVRKAIALHERFRLDICRIAWTHVKPHQFSHVVAAGFDAVIETGSLADASRGIYYLPDRSLRIQDFTELPCSCPHCQQLAPAAGPIKLGTLDDHVALLCHNTTVALDEMARIRQELRLRTFRDHLEARNHGSGLLATFQRKLDARTANIATMTTDLAARASINFIGSDSYTRPEIIKFRHKATAHFHFPPRTRWVVLLPCSAHKPYSDSPSHARFSAAMSRGWKEWRRHCSELVITSPIGVVPRQLERCFPAAHYDVPVTGYWDEQELRLSAGMLAALVNRHLASGGAIDGIVAHVDGGYRAACELGAKDIAVPVTFTGDFDSATSREALDALAATMATIAAKAGDKVNGKASGKPRGSLQDEDTRVLVDYQLGTRGAGEVLFPGDIKMRPLQGEAVQAIDRTTGQPMAVIDGESGHLTLDKQAIERLWRASLADPAIKLKKVCFCDEKIAGSSIFPGGVDLADEDIAVGDDVFVHSRDGRLLAHGTAVVPGRRMKEMRGGPVVAIAKKVEGK
jgi:archaeosine synthase